MHKWRSRQTRGPEEPVPREGRGGSNPLLCTIRLEG